MACLPTLARGQTAGFGQVNGYDLINHEGELNANPFPDLIRQFILSMTQGATVFGINIQIKMH